MFLRLPLQVVSLFGYLRVVWFRVWLYFEAFTFSLSTTDQTALYGLSPAVYDGRICSNWLPLHYLKVDSCCCATFSFFGIRPSLTTPYVRPFCYDFYVGFLCLYEGFVVACLQCKLHAIKWSCYAVIG
ncbi:hypothetical protein HanPI659440_Chr14g0553801 [Helianthus annuus]|nr:hypothetical protein HanPI659440_Chr14g0553801 [Helianthus annuus]